MMPRQLPVQVATIREFCPVCSESKTPSQVLAAVPGGDAWVLVPCPHCTNPFPLLAVVEGHREKAS
jgi:hypothetical protein